MDEVTRILNAVQGGDEAAAAELLPLAYEELRRIAMQKMAGERAGHTLQPTALVHEAYLRLLDADGQEHDWNSRAHFFGAAAEAMRRILIESVRRKQSLKRGADPVRTRFDEDDFEIEAPSDDVLDVHEALTKLEAESPELARIVKLRFFVGMTGPETAEALGVSESTVSRGWKTAKAWLYREISESRKSDKD